VNALGGHGQHTRSIAERTAAARIDFCFLCVRESTTRVPPTTLLSVWFSSLELVFRREEGVDSRAMTATLLDRSFREATTGPDGFRSRVHITKLNCRNWLAAQVRNKGRCESTKRGK
jgi:hypothetical protein